MECAARKGARKLQARKRRPNHPGSEDVNTMAAVFTPGKTGTWQPRQEGAAARCLPPSPSIHHSTPGTTTLHFPLTPVLPPRLLFPLGRLESPNS